LHCGSPVSRHFAQFVQLAQPLAAQGVQAPPLTVHASGASREYASDWSTSLDEGRQGVHGRRADASGNTDLYRIDALTGSKQLLVRGADLSARRRKPIAIEEYRLAADGSKLLVFTNSARVWRQNTKGTFFVWDVPAGASPRSAPAPDISSSPSSRPTGEWSARSRQ